MWPADLGHRHYQKTGKKDVASCRSSGGRAVGSASLGSFSRRIVLMDGPHMSNMKSVGSYARFGRLQIAGYGGTDVFGGIVAMRGLETRQISRIPDVVVA